MKRVLSGIQPTGNIHLGNLLGAVQYWVSDQESCDAFYCVVDLHALTIPRDASDLRTSTLSTAAVLLACGLDPQKCTLFIQSQVPEHPQLSWLLECTAAMGELQRMTQFKDKAAKGGEASARVGLFTYPVLMAADVLLYDADRVPVGDDQRQHLELCRDLAQRFNSRYGQTFVVPEASIPTVGPRIMDLQSPTDKMSKSAESDAGVIYVLDEPSVIERKFKRAVTDSDPEVRYDVNEKPGVANLLSILGAATGREPSVVAKDYTQYGPLKSDAASAVIELVSPIRKRYEELMSDPTEVQEALRVGATKAQSIAAVTLQRAKEAMGLLGVLPVDVLDN